MDKEGCATALISQHAHFCTDHEHASRTCLTPETVTHAVTTWRSAGPSGLHLHLNAEDVELDAPALDELLAHLAGERHHI